MTKGTGVVLGALLAGCAHSAESTNPNALPMAQAMPGTATPDEVAREKDMLMSKADGAQAGRIRDFTGDTLTVDSRPPAAPGSMTLRVDTSVPVFRGQQRVGTDVLVPGQDVRVFYQNPTDTSRPQAIAVVVEENAGDSAAPPPSQPPSADPSMNEDRPMNMNENKPDPSSSDADAGMPEPPDPTPTSMPDQSE